jgi:hypothetical protein
MVGSRLAMTVVGSIVKSRDVLSESDSLGVKDGKEEICKTK